MVVVLVSVPDHGDDDDDDDDDVGELSHLLASRQVLISTAASSAPV